MAGQTNLNVQASKVSGVRDQCTVLKAGGARLLAVLTFCSSSIMCWPEWRARIADAPEPRRHGGARASSLADGVVAKAHTILVVF
mmetsp:Transcript_27111/g.71311  ORF Transcript_27111/g.71311 Transcript_27111/m.71311 type:complete len:85 (-) Transcript_27111:138-392(-)